MIAGSSVSTVISSRICIDELRFAWLGRFDAAVWLLLCGEQQRGWPHN